MSDYTDKLAELEATKCHTCGGNGHYQTRCDGEYVRHKCPDCKGTGIKIDRFELCKQEIGLVSAILCVGLEHRDLINDLVEAAFKAGGGKVMNDYRTTDFVQVKHFGLVDGEEPNYFWRNALYIQNQDGCHVVMYASGEKEVLHKNVKIRKAITMKNDPSRGVE